MTKGIKIVVGNLEMNGWLNETATAAKVWGIMPVASKVNVWGDEIYFDIPLDTALEDGKDVVALGDIAYWPPGKSMCIFFGKTPVSKGEEIRPASPVSIIGRIKGDPKLLKEVKAGEKIVIEKG